MTKIELDNIKSEKMDSAHQQNGVNTVNAAMFSLQDRLHSLDNKLDAIRINIDNPPCSKFYLYHYYL